jgi:hypothetical protein
MATIHLVKMAIKPNNMRICLSREDHPEIVYPYSPRVSNRPIFVGAVFDRPPCIATDFHTCWYFLIMGLIGWGLDKKLKAGLFIEVKPSIFNLVLYSSPVVKIA